MPELHGGYHAIVAGDARGALAGARFALLGDVTVCWTDSQAQLLQLEPARHSGVQRTRGQLYVVGQAGRSFEREHPDAQIVASRGRYLIADLLPHQIRALRADHHACFQLRPLESGTTIYERVLPRSGTRVAWIDTLLANVSSDQLRASMEHLSAFSTRHSTSAQFVLAANWARERLLSWGFTASLSGISVPGVGASFNVIADLPGTLAAERRLVMMTAHLDSVNSAGGASAAAPGADDNASGCAGALEAARVLASLPARECDLRIVLFGGEEQGLHGSKQYVAALSAAERQRIRAVINMDMIATRNTPSATVLLEGAAVSQPLLDDVAASAATYTSLAVQRSLNPFASDHVPFLEAGVNCILTIEGADSANNQVHTQDDTMAHVDVSLAREILRASIATFASYLQPRASVVPTKSGSVVSWGPDRVDAFVIGTDSGVFHKATNGGGVWSPSGPDYEPLGGICASPVEAIAWAADRLDLFVLGTDSALYHKAWNGAGWSPDWESLGGICGSRPKAVSWGENRLDLFVLGTDSALYHKAWNGSAWFPSIIDWEPLGGTCIEHPEAVAWGPDRLDILVVGTDRKLYHKAWTGSAWFPSQTDWESLGGTILGKPKVVSWGADRLDIFVIGTDHKLYHKAWDGSAWFPSQYDWESLGGTCMGEPEVVSWGPNRLDIFVLGSDRKLYHKAWDGSAWYPSQTDWAALDGTCISGPFACSSAPNRLDVFVTGTDSALYHKAWNGSAWSNGWNSLGGLVLPAVARVMPRPELPPPQPQA